MSKKTPIKVLFAAFLAALLLVLYIELKINLQQIKPEIIKEPVNDFYCREKLLDIDIIPEELAVLNEQTNIYSTWRIVERKDSYNNELQYYTKDNVVIDRDIIVITSKKETRGNKAYTSGLVESTNAYKYGYFEFAIEISTGKGIFPAIWFLPIDGDAFPEIDLFEMIGSEPYTFYGVIHFEENGEQDSDYYEHIVPAKEQYSVALKWTDQSLTWYIDNQEIYTTTQGVPQEHMYILINQAVGGNWPGEPDDSTVFPNEFRILASHIEPIHIKGRNY